MSDNRANRHVIRLWTDVLIRFAGIVHIFGKVLLIFHISPPHSLCVGHTARVMFAEILTGETGSDTP